MSDRDLVAPAGAMTAQQIIAKAYPAATSSLEARGSVRWRQKHVLPLDAYDQPGVREFQAILADPAICAPSKDAAIAGRFSSSGDAKSSDDALCEKYDPASNSAAFWQAAYELITHITILLLTTALVLCLVITLVPWTTIAAVVLGAEGRFRDDTVLYGRWLTLWLGFLLIIAALLRGRGAIKRRVPGFLIWNAANVYMLDSMILLATGVVLCGGSLYFLQNGSSLDMDATAIALRTWLPTIALTFLFLGILLVAALFSDRASERWHRRREQTENLRRDIFEKIFYLYAGRSEPNPVALSLLLEHFVRWQVEVQRIYFGSSVKKHCEKVERLDWMTWFVAVSIALFCVAGLVLLTCSGVDEQGPALYVVQVIARQVACLESLNVDLLLIFTTALLALLFPAAATSAIAMQSRIQAQRYMLQEQKFELFLSGADLKNARAAAAAGDASGVKEFIDKVHREMADELGHWKIVGNKFRQPPSKTTPLQRLTARFRRQSGTGAATASG